MRRPGTWGLALIAAWGAILAGQIVSQELEGDVVPTRAVHQSPAWPGPAWTLVSAPWAVRE